MIVFIDIYFLLFDSVVIGLKFWTGLFPILKALFD